MSDPTPLPEDTRVLLKTLSMAFIEIRAAQFEYDEVEKALAFTHVVSDIFHNLPSGIANNRSFEEIVSGAKVKAERHGLGRWFELRLTQSRDQVGS